MSEREARGGGGGCWGGDAGGAAAFHTERCIFVLLRLQAVITRHPHGPYCTSRPIFTFLKA